MPYAIRGLVCALENCQWCGEPCFTGAAISLDGYLPQNPRWGKMFKVKVTLRPTISRSVSPGFEPHVGLVTGY
jgi:hypothetical protein